MTQLDLLYRAFGDYVKALQKDREGQLLCDAVVHAEEQDEVSIIRKVCSIDEDWVDAIERGLVFIGKAIEEDRQFIRSNGEVEPIEKVKHVSRESAEHLARHSNLINREQKNGDFLPEKLYTVERLNDYAVYENRFLYMLLCCLKDFISLRYNRIIALTNTYHGELKMKKSVVDGKTQLDYTVAFKESRQDDWYLRSSNPAREILERLERMQRSVQFYLRTPLMVEVGKSDKLKAPISKTNVLRMDKNFKEAVALYEFITAYNQDGYTVTEEEHRLNPLTDEIASELARPMHLISFLTYQHGLGLEEYLKEEYEKEEERRKKEKALLEAEQLESLKKRIKEGGGDPYQYMLLLEKRNRALEEDSRLLQEARAQIEQLHVEIDGLNERIVSLNEEMAAQKERHAEQIKAYDRRIEAMRQEQAEEAARHADALVQAEREKREQIAKIQAEAEAAVREGEEQCLRKQRELDELAAKMSERKKEDALIRARFLALRKEQGLLTDSDDFTSEEAFSELEYQYEVFGELVHGTWIEAKKLLRNDFKRALKKSLADKLSFKSHKKKETVEKTEQTSEENQGDFQKDQVDFQQDSGGETVPSGGEKGEEKDSSKEEQSVNKEKEQSVNKEKCADMTNEGETAEHE